jgi:hypothetical protein
LGFLFRILLKRVVTLDILDIPKVKNRSVSEKELNALFLFLQRATQLSVSPSKSHRIVCQ